MSVVSMVSCALAIVCALLVGCADQPARPDPSRAQASAAGEAPAPGGPAPAADRSGAPPVVGDAARGAELVARFECNRCHAGTGQPAPEPKQACVGCHEDILAGRSRARAELLPKLQQNLVSLRFAPSLSGIGARATRAWIAGYLSSPHDLRPGLPATMPRLAIDAAQAADVAAYFASQASVPESGPAPSNDPALIARGREVVVAKGCGTCHDLSGFGGGLGPVRYTSPETRAAVALAPALRHVRARSTPGALRAWLRDPLAVKRDALMPQVAFTGDELEAVVAFLLGAELEPEPAYAVPARLPILERRVTFDEVDRKIFRVTCRHCHAEADSVRGDGGPGNTGGFGFPARGLRFTSYAATLAGYLDDKGTRRSVFAPLPDGTPRLVAALTARHDEVAGTPRADLRGMPLGLPPLTAEEIQLVESWIAQGRPQ